MNRPVVAILVFAVALIAGASFTKQQSAETAATEPAWAPIPLEAVVPSSASSAEPATRVRWSGEIEEESADSAAQWRLVGIAGSMPAVALFSAEGNKTLLRLGEGESLPDGTRITAVERDGVIVEREGCRRSLTLFSRLRRSSDGACLEN